MNNIVLTPDTPINSDNIQNLIDTALLNGIPNQNPNDLLMLKYRLIETINKDKSVLYTYWLAYLCENIAILYGQLRNTEKEEAEIKEGIKLLESVEHKTSEHLALLSMMDGYAIKFCPPLRIPKHIDKCLNYAKQAIEIYPENPRAFLSLGIFEFYNQEAYGGGKKVEEYLSKALEYKHKNEPDNPIKPSWGTNIAYEFMVKYCLKNNKREKAKEICTEGLYFFPTDRNLLILNKQL